MSRIIDKAASVVSSPSVIYVILRYVTYFLAFVNALLLAKYLGGYEYGIYSFVLLIVSYMAYANLGINESLNTEYSKYKNTLRANKIWDTAWSLNLLICLAVSLLWCAVTVLDSDLFANYHFRDYGYLLIVTCLVINLGRIYITYYKLFGKLLKLNIQQILPNITILVLCLVFKTDITVNTRNEKYKVPEDFISEMRKLGYEITWTDERKYITFTCPNKMKCRDIKLHDEKYLKENIEYELSTLCSGADQSRRALL